MGRRSFGAIRRLPSGRWRASYVDDRDGRRVGAPSTFATKADASAWLSMVEADLSRGELLDPRLSRRSFGEWANEWLEGLHVKPKTYVASESSLRNHVVPTLGQRAVVTITYRDCKAFVDTMLATGYAPGTVSEARKILRLVLAEAVRADAIRRNPADRLRVPRGERQEMVFLSLPDVLRLAHSITNPPRPKRHPLQSWPAYGLLVRLAALTGLRAGEIAALRIGRVNPLHGRIEVAESAAEIHGELVYGPPKTYARRAVPIPSTLAEELRAYLRTRPGDADAFVFTSPDGGSLRHRNFYGRFFKPAVVRAGLDSRTRFHDLRHTAAALMIAEGAHLLAVKERLGQFDDPSDGGSLRPLISFAGERAHEQARRVVSRCADRRREFVAVTEPEGPPEFIILTIDEALELLGHLEDAHQSFLAHGLLSGAVLIDDQIRMPNRKLGFDDPEGQDDGY